MEANTVKVKNGKIAVIIALIFTTIAIIFCVYFGIMIKEHFDLQATAEGWEGLGSIGIVLVGLIAALCSILSTLLSTLFSVIAFIRGIKKIKLISVILFILNFIIIITNTILFVVLKQ